MKQLGLSVSINHDGSRFVTIAPGLDYASPNIGISRVYEWVYGKWTQMGQDIIDEGINNQRLNTDGTQNTVSMNDDGDIVAIGAPYYSNHGYVRVFQYDGNNWVKIGNDIQSEYQELGESFGIAVNLNSAGNIIAIAGVNKDQQDINFDRGYVRIYENINENWTRTSEDMFFDDRLDDYSGKTGSLSLNSAGDVLALGAAWVDLDLEDNRGETKVYKKVGSEWVNPVEWRFLGEASGDESGNSVSLNAAGNILAIGAPENYGTFRDGIDKYVGHVRVYQLDEDGASQIGEDIDGEYPAYDQSGWSVSLSDAGNVLAIGAPSNNKEGNKLPFGNPTYGHVRIYKFINNTWFKIAEDIDGEQKYEYSGNCVSLSGNGKVVAVGAPYSYNKMGTVRIYGYYTQAFGLQSDVFLLDETSNKIIRVTLATDKVVRGEKVYYTISGSGITKDDFIGLDSLKGYFEVGVDDSKEFEINQDFLTEGSELFTLALDNGAASTDTIKINDTSKTATYIFSALSSIDEGQALTITLNTTEIDNDTIMPYTISGAGITPDDFGLSSLTGSFTIINNTASVTFNIAEDFSPINSENIETFTLTLDGRGAMVSVDINDTSTQTFVLTTSTTTVDEGGQVIITLNTTGVADGTIVQYAISGNGITASDLGLNSLNGTFTIIDDTASVIFDIANDVTTEGDELFALSLVDNGGASTGTIRINDTSKTPTYTLTSAPSVNEGDEFTITLNTTGVADGTVLPYKISGVNIIPDDFSLSSLTGSFTVVNNTASLTLDINEDFTKEGSEYFTLALDNGKVSKTMIVADTSQGFGFAPMGIAINVYDNSTGLSSLAEQSYNTSTKFHTSTALSADGLIYAVGNWNGGTIQDLATGAVATYRYDSANNEWLRYADIIEDIGEENNISLNSAGTILAVGNSKADNYFKFKIFNYVNGNWELIIEKDEINNIDGYGSYSVALNNAGDRIITGAWGGVVSVWNINNNILEQVGSPIIGLAGSNVSINGEGNIITVIEYQNGASVYKYDNIANDWVKIGNNVIAQDIENPSEIFDSSLSDDGYTVAIGTEGFASIYEYDEATNIWNHINTMYDALPLSNRNNITYDYHKRHISMSSDAKLIAIGWGLNVANDGLIRVYDVQTGEVGFDYNEPLSRIGTSVSLNADGTILAPGFVKNDINIDYIYTTNPLTVRTIPTYTFDGPDFIQEYSSNSTFQLNTTGIADGTVRKYTISGDVTPSDLGLSSLTGSLTIIDNTASIVMNIFEDLMTEGDEFFTITLDEIVKTVSKTVGLADTSTPRNRELSVLWLGPNEALDVRQKGIRDSGRRSSTPEYQYPEPTPPGFPSDWDYDISELFTQTQYIEDPSALDNKLDTDSYDVVIINTVDWFVGDGLLRPNSTTYNKLKDFVTRGGTIIKWGEHWDSRNYVNNPDDTSGNNHGTVANMVYDLGGIIGQNSEWKQESSNIKGYSFPTQIALDNDVVNKDWFQQGVGVSYDVSHATSYGECIINSRSNGMPILDTIGDASLSIVHMWDGGINGHLNPEVAGRIIMFGDESGLLDEQNTAYSAYEKFHDTILYPIYDYISRSLVNMATYNFVSPSSVYKGQQLTINLFTAHVVSGTTIPYIIRGVSSDDISGASTTGIFTIIDDIGSVTLDIANDATAQYLTMSLNNGERGSTGTIAINDRSTATYIFSAPSSMEEGQSSTITLNTTEIDNGTIMPYTISGTGITPADFGLSSLTGSFTIYNNTASVILSAAFGATNRADKTFTITLDSGEASTIPITISTPTYTLKAQNTIVEDNQLVIILNTTGLVDNTIIPYTITGSISSDDIFGVPLTGSFAIFNNTASLTFDISLINSENIETFTLTLDSIGEAISVNINNTSIQTFALTASPETVDEEKTVFVRLRTQGISSGVVLPYTISGTNVTADALNLDSLTGGIDVRNGRAALVITLVRDATTRGIEAFTFALDNGEANIEVGVSYVPPYWQQVGQDFYYHPIFEGRLQAPAYQASMNSVGDIVAVAYDLNSGYPYSSLKDALKVYSDNDGSWTQLGGDIIGSDYYEFNVHKLNSAGNMIAVASSGQTGFNIDQGDRGSYVSIWQLNNETWEQVGQSIYDPDELNDNFPNRGWAVDIDINDDCSIVAISNSLGSTRRVNARVYKNINGTWTQLGQDLHPSADYAAEGINSPLISLYGKNIALNSAGNVLAMGDSIYRTYTGQVRIWEYINSTWTQVALFDGPLYEDEALGEAITLNSAGDMFAALGTRYVNGGPYGFIRIYENINGTWEQTSQINGPYTPNVGRLFGGVLSFNAAGNILFVGSKSGGSDAKRGFVFKLDPTIDGLFKWEEVGQEVADAYSGMINSAGDRFIAVDNITSVWNTTLCAVYELNS